MKLANIKKIFLALSLGFGLSGFASVTAVAGPALTCNEMEEQCRLGDRYACIQLEFYCGIGAP
ncbi:hypothetical protein [Thalassomonas actiniarum]|uniref:Uncharacterized protein n=1 Tax=Thalassomonas actiniarum TaxID=485447 RepID=A0AAE9YHY8_9GAMM|nr:hypothetical protein [Thalassomonas actiniarum]WDD96769.1 hypothetical protein SG35_015440 [Thalassomonas actiniarum]